MKLIYLLINQRQIEISYKKNLQIIDFIINLTNKSYLSLYVFCLTSSVA
jgi:hypothetical protein